MLFIEPLVTPIDDANLEKKIERAYRICYKSERFIKAGSEELLSRLLHNNNLIKHTSPLAHGIIQLNVSDELKHVIETACNTESLLWNTWQYFRWDQDDTRWQLSVNLRALFVLFEATSNENHEYDSLAYTSIWQLADYLHSIFPHIFRAYKLTDNLQDCKLTLKLDDKLEYLGPDTKYKTFYIVTTRDILQEIARHTTLYPSVESTRYCDYNKRGIVFTKPNPYSLNIDYTVTDDANMYELSGNSLDHKDELKSIDELAKLDSFEDLYIQSCRISEMLYNRARELNIRPEQARMLLPGGLKTELVLTGTYEAWHHFLQLRTAKEAHPQIRIIADQIERYLNADSRYTAMSINQY